MQNFEFKNLSEENYKTRYRHIIAPTLQKKHNIKNVHAIPYLDKIVLNVRVGKAKIIGGSTTEKQKKPLEKLLDNFTLIAGQKPVSCAASCSVSNFKIREGDIVGMKVTLRKEKMYSFLEKLVMIAFPRSRNFKPFKSTSIDKNGNFTLTVKGSEVFPEGEMTVSYPISVVLVLKNIKNKEQAIDLLREFYIPIN
ncbi:MAG: 50S ribosomal protein L5 [Rickettsiales bacterium]